MCKVVAVDPRRPSQTRTYTVPEAKVPQCKRALALAGYLVSIR